jgi:hypothetical protein
MTYTLNGKEWTEFDINKRCAVLTKKYIGQLYDNEKLIGVNGLQYNPCENWSDAGRIINNCWDELMETTYDGAWVKWDFLIKKHNCTKLVAACICYIEINEAKS